MWKFNAQKCKSIFSSIWKSFPKCIFLSTRGSVSTALISHIHLHSAGDLMMLSSTASTNLDLHTPWMPFNYLKLPVYIKMWISRGTWTHVILLLFLHRWMECPNHLLNFISWIKHSRAVWNTFTLTYVSNYNNIHSYMQFKCPHKPPQQSTVQKSWVRMLYVQ